MSYDRASLNAPVDRRSLLGVLSLLPLQGTFGCRRGSAGVVRVGVSALRISLPVFVALEQGLFAQENLRVEARRYPTAQPLVDDVTLGNLDVGGFAAWPIVLLASARASAPLRVASALVEDREHRISYVLRRKHTALRFPGDARGKTIGVLPTAAYRRWLAALLTASGIAPSEVTVVPVEPALQAETLARGGVDLLFTNDPMATAMLQRNLAELADDGPPCPALLGSPFSFGTFLFSGRFYEQNPTVSAAVLRVLDRAIARTLADPAGALRALQRHLRPEERAYAQHYPPASYRTSTEHSLADLTAEIARERTLGILDRNVRVRLLPGDQTP